MDQIRIGVLLLSIFLPGGLMAQAPQAAAGAKPAGFVAADVHPSPVSFMGNYFHTSPFTGDRFVVHQATPLDLITTAYHVGADAVTGGPPGLEFDHYDIVASTPPGTTDKDTAAMLQSLLADRFKLALHRETRELPVYNLVAAKGAFNPPPPDPACAEPDTAVPAARGAMPCRNLRIGMSGSVDGGNAPMSQLVATLAAIVGRPVIDQTGFTGTLDVHLKFAPDQSTQGLPGGAISVASPEPDPSRPDILSALQEQLGLRLTSSKGPVEVLVIDHVERPTAN